MIRYAMNPPSIPNIAAEAPTVTFDLSQSVLNRNPELLNHYQLLRKQGEQ